MTEPPVGSPEGFGGWADRAVETALRWASVVSMFVLVVLVSALVLVRFVPFWSLGWADEIVELVFAWMVFLGTAAVWRSHEHIAIDLVPQALAGTRGRRVLGVVAGVLVLGFLAVFTWEGWFFTMQARGNTSPMLMMPKPLWYAVLPLSGLVMMAYTVRQCVGILRSAASDRPAR